MYQTKLAEKLKEALGAVVPIALIVLVLSLTLVSVPSGTLLTFLFGSMMLIVGMMFFTLGRNCPGCLSAFTPLSSCWRFWRRKIFWRWRLMPAA